MKIYCILNDSVPYGSILEQPLCDKGFTKLTQISHCFTVTSIISMLTGKLPSDLEKGGIGYQTQNEHKTKGIVDYSWKDKLLISELNKKNWGINFHSGQCFYETTCDEPFIKKTNPFPIVKEAGKYKENIDYFKIILQESTETSEFYKNEKKFIKQFQKPSKRNEFYLITNSQYHLSLITKTNKIDSLKRIQTVLDYFDFDEPDSLFWIFSDHHNFLEIDELCKCPSFLTTVFVKDNRQKPLKLNSDIIAISDFYDIFKKGYNTLDEKRIYFVEDGRVHVDPLNSTTAVACKFLDKKHILQVSYFRPTSKYFGFVYDISMKKIQECSVDSTLANALKERFEWVK